MNGQTYGDPPGLAGMKPDVVLSDDLERAAIALFNMRHMTPEDVGVMLARNDAALVKAWIGGPGVRESDRNLYRRRASIVVDAHAGALRAVDAGDDLLSEAMGR